MSKNPIQSGSWPSAQSMLTWGDVAEKSRQSPATKNIATFLSSQIQNRSSRVLDIGCGNGRFIQQLSTHWWKYVGVDDSDLLHQAYNAYPSHSGFERDFFKKDVTHGLNFLKDREFDFIMMLFCLHFIDPTKVLFLLKEAKTYLARNWKMIFIGSAEYDNWINEYVEHCFNDAFSKNIETRNLKSSRVIIWYL